MTLSHIRHEPSPRSTNALNSSEHGSRGSSPRHSARTKSLDLDLRNAPCYHAAIMRLLPCSTRRGLTMHHPTAPPPLLFLPQPHPQFGQRECFCEKDRKHGYRKDWRPDHHPHCNDASPPHKISTLLRSSAHVNEDPFPAPPAAEPRTSNDVPLERCFKSGTVYLEVKLAELLSRHKHASSANTCRVPDAHCFGVCWQLLGELSRMKTPFAQTFSVIYQQLDKSLHSSYVAAKNGSSASTFQRVPYFELICKLRDRKLEIEIERENLEAEILTCQVELGHVEQGVKGSKEKLVVAEGVAREMERKLSTILDALEATLAQVRTLQEEMLQLKRKMQKAKVEQAKAHEVQYEQMMRQERHAKLEENYKSMLQGLQEAQAEIDVVRHQASDSVPKEELGVAKAKVDELQKTLAELQAKADQQIATSGELTPRPLWEELLLACMGHDYSQKPTAELLVDICKHNVYLTHNISRLHEDCVTAQASIFKKYHAPQDKHLVEQNATVDSKSSPGLDTNVSKIEVKKSQKGWKSTPMQKKR